MILARNWVDTRVAIPVAINLNNSVVRMSRSFVPDSWVAVAACWKVLAVVVFTALGVKWSQPRGGQLNPAVPTKNNYLNQSVRRY